MKSPAAHRPAYRIDTERLVLRCWDPADAPLLQDAINSSLDHLLPWICWAHGKPVDIQTRVEWLRAMRAAFDRDEDYVYGIFDAGETRVLGGTGLHTRPGKGVREIGYWIRADRAGQGLITESTAALVRVGFEVDALHRIVIHCDPRNAASAAIPRKLGFTHEATLRQHLQWRADEWRDSMIWTLLASEYVGSPAYGAPVQAWDAMGRRLI